MFKPSIWYLDPSAFGGFSEVPYPYIYGPKAAAKFLSDPPDAVFNAMDATKVITVHKKNGQLFGFAFSDEDTQDESLRWQHVIGEGKIESLAGYYPIIPYQEMGTIQSLHSVAANASIERFSTHGVGGYDVDWPALYSHLGPQDLLLAASAIWVDRPLLCECAYPIPRKIISRHVVNEEFVQLFQTSYDAWVSGDMSREEMKNVAGILDQAIRHPAYNIAILRDFIRMTYTYGTGGALADLLGRHAEYAKLIKLASVKKILRPIDFMYALIKYEKIINANYFAGRLRT